MQKVFHKKRIKAILFSVSLEILLILEDHKRKDFNLKADNADMNRLGSSELVNENQGKFKTR